MDKVFLTHRQLARMAQVTDGYHPENVYELEVTVQGIAYLEVMHLTYVIDPVGTYCARATDHGKVIIPPTLWPEVSK